MKNKKPFIGAIRWDAWLPGDADTTKVGQRGVGQQVSDTLSQQKFHFRVPYFANLHSDGVTISYPEPTQELFDQEMQYAADMGIDYFAYCMYEDNSGLDYARVFHTQSKLRNKVKMSAILSAGPYDNMKHIGDLVDCFQQEYYMKVCGGRPLVFFFAYIKDETEKEIAALRTACKNAGVPDPYIAAMFWNQHEIKEALFDAVSGYGFSGNDGQSFVSLTEKARGRWEEAKSRGQKLIPMATTGWDPRPRIERPVSWMNIAENCWAQTPKDEEIVTHIQQTMDYIHENNELCEAETLVIYAWNENDEGGWLVPTGKLGNDGLLMRNADGSLIPDTSRLEAIKKIL